MPLLLEDLFPLKQVAVLVTMVACCSLRVALQSALVILAVRSKLMVVILLSVVQPGVSYFLEVVAHLMVVVVQFQFRVVRAGLKLVERFKFVPTKRNNLLVQSIFFPVRAVEALQVLFH